MSIELQKIAVRYRNELIVPVAHEVQEHPLNVISAFLRNLEALGFGANLELANSLRFFNGTTEEFKEWAGEVISTLKGLKGANFSYEPMYPNFPDQVAFASDTELFINALKHYFGDVLRIRVIPEYEKEERFPFYEDTNLTVLGLASDDLLVDVARNLLQSAVSLSETDIESLSAVVSVSSVATLQSVIDGVSIPNKENLATFAGLVRGLDVTLTASVFAQAKTVTDVLRIAAVYSNAHPSLSEKFRFGKFSRAERRLFVQTLNRMKNLSEDFKRNRELWKRLGERLHVSELGANPQVSEAFAQVRSSRNIATWSTQVENAFNELNVVVAVDLLKERPGEFARRLNHLLSIASSDEEEYILQGFRQVASKASTSVLWQLSAFLKTLQSNPDRKFSTIFPKGVKASAFAVQRNTTATSEGVINVALRIVEEALTEVYASRESMGKVFFDWDGVYNPAVPFGLRNTSGAFRVVGRGTRSVFDTDKTLRFFIHWRNQDSSRVDLDLSAVMLDENFNLVGQIAYYNLRDVGAVHSGDITSAPNGASEFIDVNVKTITSTKKNVRYVAMTVHSFTRQKFSELDEVLAGFMTRSDAKSGEIYEPKSVENAFKVNSDTTVVIPMVFDLVTGEAIWVDVASTGNYLNNVNKTHRSMSAVLQGIVGRHFVTVADVINANVAARAEVVEDAEEADTVIVLRNGESSIGFDELIAKWL